MMKEPATLLNWFICHSSAIPIAAMAILLGLPPVTGCRTTCYNMGGVTAPTLPVRRPEVVADIRDYDYQPLEGATVRLYKQIGHPEEIAIKMQEHWAYAVSLPYAGTYTLEVSYPGRQTERRKLETTGGSNYELFTLVPTGEPVYYVGGERRAVDQRGPLQILVRHARHNAVVQSEAVRLGFRIVEEFPPPHAQDHHLLLSYRRSGGWQALSTAMRELNERTRVSPDLVVQNCSGNLTAISTKVTLSYYVSPQMHRIFDSLGFDTTSINSLGSGLRRMRYRGVADRQFLDAVQALADHSAVLRVDNDRMALGPSGNLYEYGSGGSR